MESIRHELQWRAATVVAWYGKKSLPLIWRSLGGWVAFRTDGCMERGKRENLEKNSHLLHSDLSIVDWKRKDLLKLDYWKDDTPRRYFGLKMIRSSMQTSRFIMHYASCLWFIAQLLLYKLRGSLFYRLLRSHVVDDSFYIVLVHRLFFNWLPTLCFVCTNTLANALHFNDNSIHRDCGFYSYLRTCKLRVSLSQYLSFAHTFDWLHP